MTSFRAMQLTIVTMFDVRWMVDHEIFDSAGGLDLPKTILASTHNADSIRLSETAFERQGEIVNCCNR